MIMSYVVIVICTSQVLMYASVYALENLALNKPTWQEHPWPDQSRDYGSENAVDGLNTDHNVGKGQCTVNAEGYFTAEWRVDLGSAYRIRYISIYYRTDNQSPGPFVNRMAGFSLYISNTTFKEQGHFCYKHQSGGKPSVKQNISCSIYGRYVIYYNERSRDQNSSFLSRYAFNELCEVEVYGCQGSYGEGCLYMCPTNCLNGMCDTYTGRCLSCYSGYYGSFCENDKCRDQQQCSDNTSIVIGVVLTAVIVIAIVMNIIGWRRKTGHQTQKREEQQKSKDIEKDNGTSEHYTELGEVGKSNTYDQIVSYAN